MQNTHDFNYILLDSINADEWRVKKDEFARSNLSANPPHVRKLRERVRAFYDAAGHRRGRRTSMFFKGIIANRNKIVCCWRSPSDSHLTRKPAMNQLHDVFMINQLTAFCCRQPLIHLSAKPFIIVNASQQNLLNKGLDVLPAFRSQPREFRL